MKRMFHSATDKFIRKANVDSGPLGKYTENVLKKEVEGPQLTPSLPRPGYQCSCFGTCQSLLQPTWLQGWAVVTPNYKAQSYPGCSCRKCYRDGWKRTVAKVLGKMKAWQGQVSTARPCWTLSWRWGSGLSSWYCPWIDHWLLQGSKEKTLFFVTVALSQYCLTEGSASSLEVSQLQNALHTLPQVPASASCYTWTILAAWILFPASEWLGSRCVSRSL